MSKCSIWRYLVVWFFGMGLLAGCGGEMPVDEEPATGLEPNGSLGEPTGENGVIPPTQGASDVQPAPTLNPVQVYESAFDQLEAGRILYNPPDAGAESSRRGDYYRR